MHLLNSFVISTHTHTFYNSNYKVLRKASHGDRIIPGSSSGGAIQSVLVIIGALYLAKGLVPIVTLKLPTYLAKGLVPIVKLKLPIIKKNVAITAHEAMAHWSVIESHFQI